MKEHQEIAQNIVYLLNLIYTKKIIEHSNEKTKKQKQREMIQYTEQYITICRLKGMNLMLISILLFNFIFNVFDLSGWLFIAFISIDMFLIYKYQNKKIENKQKELNKVLENEDQDKNESEDNSFKRIENKINQQNDLFINTLKWCLKYLNNPTLDLNIKTEIQNIINIESNNENFKLEKYENLLLELGTFLASLPNQTISANKIN